MNRRNILKLIGLGSIGSFIPFSTKAKNNGNLIYKDFEIHWTGWKNCVDSTRVVGQWIATSKKKMWGEFGFDIVNICSCVPNRYGADQFLKGAVFNIVGGLYIESPEKEKEHKRLEAYRILVNGIDTLYSMQEYYKKKHQADEYYSKFKFGFTGFKK